MAPAAELPPPPRLPRHEAVARRRPRDRKLSRATIVDTALAIVDREGLDALTMRSVAAALGTGPASLYAHFASKEELVESVVEKVIGEVSFDQPPDPDRWIQQLQQLGQEVRAMWARHRDLARASFARIPLGENALEGSESMISIMRAGGLSDRAVGLGCDLLALYIGAVAYEESIQPQGMGAPAEMADFVAQLQAYFASLPVDRFPGIVALAGALTQGDGEERFDFGLEVLIHGLIAVSARE